MSEPSVFRKSVSAGALISIGALFSTATKPYEPKAKAAML